MEQLSMIVQSFHNAFAAYLQQNCKCSEERVHAIMHVAEDLLPDFVCQNIDADFRSLYDVKDAKQLSFYQDAIALDTILKAEDRSLEEVGYTDTLIYYRRFLKSSFHPDHKDYVPPALVPGEKTSNAEDEEKHKNLKLKEGADLQEMHVTPRERSKELREACIEHFKKLHGGHLVCECCGFDFSLAYKDIGEGYIEIHHRFPFSKTEGEHEVDPITDLVPLCSNCHSMIHRVGGQGECMSVEELKEKYFIGKRYN